MRISRVCLALICGQFSADTISQAQACGKNRRKRQKAATNLSQFAAFCHWQLPQFVAFGSMQLNGFQYRSTLAVHALEYTLKLTTRTNGSERLKVEIMP
jgi:hypothetical protein